MSNYQKDSSPTLHNWQIAYLARDLRHNKKIIVNCLKQEAFYILEQLNSFSSPYPIISKTIDKPNSQEIYLEVSETL